SSCARTPTRTAAAAARRFAPRARTRAAADRSRHAAHLDVEERGDDHVQQMQTIPKTADLRRAVRPRAVVHGDVDRADAEDRGGEEKLEGAERGELAERLAPADEALVVVARQQPPAPQRVADAHVPHRPKRPGGA